MDLCWQSAISSHYLTSNTPHPHPHSQILAWVSWYAAHFPQRRLLLFTQMTLPHWALTLKFMLYPLPLTYFLPPMFFSVVNDHPLKCCVLLFIYLYCLLSISPPMFPEKIQAPWGQGFFFFFSVFSLIYPQRIKRCLVQNKSVSDEWIDENGEV